MFNSIETERLIIRKHIDNDYMDLYEYLSLPKTYLFEPGNPINIAEAKQMIAERSSSDNFFAVVLKSENKMIGHLYFNHEEPKEHLKWELGYIFNPKYHRKGYATEASKKIISYAFAEFNAHRITAYCNPENIASWRVLEKAGMNKEGFFPKNAFFRRDENGNPLWFDCLAYGILNNK